MNTDEIGDKQWGTDTIAQIEKELTAWGMTKGDYWWTHPDASFSLEVGPAYTGGWTRKRDYDVIEISSSNSIRSFRKAIRRERNNTVEVLAKIYPKLRECIEQRAENNRAYQTRKRREAFREQYLTEHFANTGKVHVTIDDGDTPETVQLGISARYLTPEMVKRIIDLVNGK